MYAHRAHLAIAAAALTGCGFTADFAGGRFRCAGGEACPSGTTCAASGYCEAPQADGGPGGDAGVAAACGTTDVLRDPFDDPARLARFWQDDSSGGGTSAIDGGRLVLALPAGDPALAGRTTNRWYRFQDSGLAARVLQPATGTAWLGIYLRFAGGIAMQLVAGEGQIRAERFDDAGLTTLGARDYQPAGEATWRVRDDGGVLRFELDDGAGWSEIGSTREIPAEPVQVSFYFNDGQARDQPVAAAIADLNLDATGGQCAASSLTDDFDDGVTAIDWETWRYGACEFREEAGRLRFHNMANEYTDCGYRSRAGYDLRGDAIAIEVPPPEPDAGTLVFGVRIEDDHYLRIELRAGGATMQARDVDQLVGDAPYAADAARYWQIAHDQASDQVRFSYSADGASWTELGSTRGTDVSDVQIALYAADQAAGDGEVAFDRLNLLAR